VAARAVLLASTLMVRRGGVVRFGPAAAVTGAGSARPSVG
jgi:hypothetical protein